MANYPSQKYVVCTWASSRVRGCVLYHFCSQPTLFFLTQSSQFIASYFSTNFNIITTPKVNKAIHSLTHHCLDPGLAFSKKTFDMDRETLKRSGVYFQEDVDETRIDLLPAHVRSLRNAALDFDFTIPDRGSCHTDDDLKDLERRGFEGIAPAERSEFMSTLIGCSEAIEEARILTSGADREAEWAAHFVKWFLDPLYESSKVKDEDTREYVSF
jgi:hypothetical protein